MDDKMWQDAMALGRCPLGCSLKKKTCQHLDNYLNKRSGRGINAIPTANIEALAARRGKAQDVSGDIDRLEQRMLLFGLSPTEATILMLHFCWGKSFRQTAKEVGLSHHCTVIRIKDRALTKLREAGFSIGYKD